MNAQVARLAALYGPTVGDLADQLPAIADSLSVALTALAADPTAARAGMALIQVNGLSAFVGGFKWSMQHTSP